MQEKEKMKKYVAEVLESVKANEGQLGGLEFRRLCNLGVPMVEICAKNIPIECLERGIEERLNKRFGKEE
jgi:hypothetical protein